MAEYDFELFVIGGGSAGVRAARLAANYGARVALAEDADLGGTCVNVGCIPKKLFVMAAHYGEDFEDSEAFGWTPARPTFDWPRLIANKDREIARLNGVYAKILGEAGVKIIPARAVVTGPHGIAVGGKDVSTEHILIVTGSWPVVPDIAGRAHAMTSNEAFHLERLPARIVIVGGGYIAVEFAGIFHGLGMEVTQLYRGELFLRGFDDDIRAHLAGEMRKKGIDLRFNANIARIEKGGKGLAAILEGGGEIATDAVMFATGRAPRTEGLGLAEAGVELDASGAVKVGEGFQSSVPSIHAMGDVIDRVQLTPVALAEATVFAKNLFGGVEEAMDYANIPSTVFSQPPLGTVGLSEAQAREKFGEVDIYKSQFRPLKHTLTGRDEQTLMKLVIDADSDRVVGLHMVGAEAGEIVQGFAVAMKCGATKADFDATIGIHPTSAEEFVTLVRHPGREKG